jgi:hypothetical protein
LAGGETLTTSPPNHIHFLLVRARKITNLFQLIMSQTVEMQFFFFFFQQYFPIQLN